MLILSIVTKITVVPSQSSEGSSSKFLHTVDVPWGYREDLGTEKPN